MRKTPFCDGACVAVVLLYEPDHSLGQKAAFVRPQTCLTCLASTPAQCTTLYNSEMAPAKLRGALNILFQWMVTIGILVAQLINYGTQHLEWGWRLSLGLAFIPAFVLFCGALLWLAPLLLACDEEMTDRTGRIINHRAYCHVKPSNLLSCLCTK